MTRHNPKTHNDDDDDMTVTQQSIFLVLALGLVLTIVNILPSSQYLDYFSYQDRDSPPLLEEEDIDGSFTTKEQQQQPQQQPQQQQPQQQQQLVPVPMRKLNQSRFQVLVCRNCKRQSYNDTVKCGDLLHRQWRETNPTLPNAVQSMELLSRHKTCSQCQPTNCFLLFPTATNPNDTMRLDEVAPPILRAVSHDLLSIPTAFQQARFVPEAYQLDTNYSGIRPLFTYNPTIQRYSHEHYVASFRVGNFPWLRTNPNDKDNHTTHHQQQQPYRNYLGLALLDHKTLGIVVDAVFDVNEFDGYSRKESGKFDDYRLVRNDENSHFYLSNGIYLWQIDIEVSGLPIPATTTITPPLGDDPVLNKRLSIPPLFVSKEHGNVSIKLWVYGRRAGFIDGLHAGRNFNFFHVQNHWFIEIWPLPRQYAGTLNGRVVGPVRINETVPSNITFSLGPKAEGTNDPPPPFVGDEKDFLQFPLLYRKTNARGTACCIRLERKHYQDLVSLNNNHKNKNNQTNDWLDHPYLLVGVAHVKSRKRIQMTQERRYGYLSNFYAFAPTVPPDQIVAQSPLFCWGFPTTLERPRPIQLPHDDRLHWRQEKGPYNCPVVQFPSGIVDSISDPTTFIVAYGIEDQTSRMVEIRKRDVALLLFSPAPWMGR